MWWAYRCCSVAWLRGRTASMRTVKSRGPDTPTLVSRSKGWTSPAADGGQQARSTGENAKQPFQPSRGECRDVSAEPVVPAACIFFCRRAMGAASSRHSPCPLRGEGMSRGKARTQLRREMAAVRPAANDEPDTDVSAAHVQHREQERASSLSPTANAADDGHYALPCLHVVMARLVPAIHVVRHAEKDVDARAFAAPKRLRPRRRDKPGHDGETNEQPFLRPWPYVGECGHAPAPETTFTSPPHPPAAVAAAARRRRSRARPSGRRR